MSGDFLFLFCVELSHLTWHSEEDPMVPDWCLGALLVPQLLWWILGPTLLAQTQVTNKFPDEVLLWSLPKHGGHSRVAVVTSSGDLEPSVSCWLQRELQKNPTWQQLCKHAINVLWWHVQSWLLGDWPQSDIICAVNFQLNKLKWPRISRNSIIHVISCSWTFCNRKNSWEYRFQGIFPNGRAFLMTAEISST